MSRLEIKARENGPYKIVGEMTYLDADGQEQTISGSIALCRCGASANKPFCDKSHRKIAFEAPLMLLNLEINNG